MATSGMTGKAGSITVGGTVIPITKCNSKQTIAFADATDSGNYDSGSGNLYKSQLSGDVQIEMTIEGNYDTATTSANIIGKMKAPSSGPYAAVFKLNGSTTLFSGNVDLTDMETSLTVPGAEMVTFTCTAKSNGSYTLTG